MTAPADTRKKFVRCRHSDRPIQCITLRPPDFGTTGRHDGESDHLEPLSNADISEELSAEAVSENAEKTCLSSIIWLTILVNER